MLETLKVKFELILVDRKSNAQKEGSYLELNPAGKILVLVKDDFVLSESTAICIFLAESHPEADLIPNLSEQKRGLFFKWMMYLTGTLQAELMIYFDPEKHLPATDLEESERVKGLRKRVIKVQEEPILDAWELIENELESKTFLLGDKVSICDFFLFMLAIWSGELPRPPLEFPNTSALLQRMVQFDSVKAVCEKEKISLKPYQ